MKKKNKPKGNILVVEDDKDYSIMISSVLEFEGYQITPAYTCEEAIEKVHESTFDLITLDLQMPYTQRMNGIHFYREIKLDEKLRRIPVIVVTGIMNGNRDMDNLVRSFLEIDRVPPPDAYIDKPFNIKVLIDTVEKVLQTKTSWTSE